MRQENKPDPRHKFWECQTIISRDPRETCNTLVDVNQMKCHMCGYEITGADKVRAVDEHYQHIGNLYSYDSTYGEMIWEYFD
ncbi:hypothetical protein FANTH_7208 [Fusarium anthophilum]|uniref:Uncharacterized protein n=1 Tax=Fusarium anthophilum TaxID=48485 RepID=A0A8H5E3H7_9HYPO|nr:hypothetical protein FANTH_7208 [Fusarium anthophilum]